MIKTLLISLGLFFHLSAQSDSLIIFSDPESDLVEDLSGEREDSELFDLLEELKTNPVNLNTADELKLQAVPFIDLSIAKSIIDYREKFGPFFSTGELYSIKDLSQETVKKIIPFLTVDTLQSVDEPIAEKSFLEEVRINNRTRIISDIQDRKGFTNGNYLGSKYKLYNRTMFSSRRFKAGVLFEKDPGEQRYNDFTSLSISVNNFWLFDKAAAGDYLFEFGQGLVLWSPYGYSKGSEVISSAKKRSRGISSYMSSDENNFFRGAAASVRLSDFIISAFYSKNRFDARLNESTGKIISAPADGYHRTISEINRRKTAFERITGAAAEFKRTNFSIGLLHFSSNFDKEFEPQTVYGIKGSEYSYTSISYDFIWENINIFGETAYDGLSVASVSAMQIMLDKNIQLINSLRSYPRNFISLHGSAFAERSGVNNELGIYFGLKWKNILGIFNAYFDQFKFPYSVAGSIFPTKGKEFLLDFRSKKFSIVRTGIRYKYEKKEGINAEIKQSFRGELSFEPSKNLRIRNRIEITEFKAAELENGFMIFNDIRYSGPFNFAMYGRIIFFKTDSFSSAIYEFENDLYGMFTNLPMYGEGIRWYLIAKFSPIELLTISVKYSETYKPKERSLGSGNSEIIGNIDNKISLQMDLKL